MFSLIITIISIALVAALAVATLFYGGSVFSSQGEKARYAQVMNEVNQVQSALAMRKVDFAGPPSSLGDLIPRYMTALPKGWDAGERDGYLTLALSDLAVETCLRVNDELGVENPAGEPPVCPASSSAVFTGCCTTE